jgi:hypothetical protein
MTDDGMGMDVQKVSVIDKRELAQENVDSLMREDRQSETRLAVQASDARKTNAQQEIELLTEKISAITGKDWLLVENVPSIAYVLTKMPLAKGATLSYVEAIAMAFTAITEGANPFTGELYRTGPFRFATNVQAKINKLRKQGIQVGVPQFEPRIRDWPEGKKLTRYDVVTRREVAFSMPNEPGMTCKLPIGRDSVSQTVWLIENYVATNANWFERMDHMLQVRALGRCVTFGGGEGVSEPIGLDAPEDVKQVEETEFPKIKVSK